MKAYKIFAVILLIILTGCAGTLESKGARKTRRGAVAGEAPGELSDLTVSAAEDMNGQVLGSFSTNFNEKEKRRAHNIRLASDSINQCVVQPGETFSYNETVGPTSRKNGYKLSTIFVKGEKEEGYGGGVCQVSSTLYNAAANAGMVIVERHDHSRPVPYVEAGKDAATSYGGIDFKFQNNQPFSVMINSRVEGGEISVSISAL
ncbi:MAG: VanW family protein [Clostridiales bacterium]|jgi:vancomycin resistance protein YoaR|nr:VanW family protein [Clostridiales bacterium]